MIIEINTAGFKLTDPIKTRVEEQIRSNLKGLEPRLTRIEVHLEDQNGPKQGIDMRCLMEARIAGQQPMAVEAKEADLYDAIGACATKLGRAVRHKIERLSETH